MTMAAAASKQGTILGRLWKALLLSRSKKLKENKKLMKRPKRAKKKERKKKEENCLPIFSGKRPFIWVLTLAHPKLAPFFMFWSSKVPLSGGLFCFAVSGPGCRSKLPRLQLNFSL